MNNWLIYDIVGEVMKENLTEQEAVALAKDLSFKSGEEVYVAQLVYTVNG
jgi:hypothetical protein